MAIYHIRVRCNDVTPSEILNDYISALDFPIAMRLGMAHFDDREIDAFSCEELSLKDIHLKLLTAIVNDSESDDDKPSEVLNLGSVLIDEINNLQSQLSTMEEKHDCTHDNADEDLDVTEYDEAYRCAYELGYEDGLNGYNTREYINPQFQSAYDCGHTDAQKDEDSKWY